MPSTFSPSLRIELIASGEKSGDWGVFTNNNLGDLIEQAITGNTALDVTAGMIDSWTGVPVPSCFFETWGGVWRSNHHLSREHPSIY